MKKFGNYHLSSTTLLALLTGLNLLNYVDRYLLNGVLVPLQQEFGLTDAQLGRLNTVFMLGYFLTAPFFGYLGDFWSRKKLIAFGVGVGGLATLLTGSATTYFALLITRVFVGLGEASYATISPGLLSDKFLPEKRNNALTIFYTALPVGAALGYILGGQFHQAMGWRQGFFWIGLLSVLVTFALQPFEEVPRAPTTSNESVVTPSLKNIFRVFRIPDFSNCIWGYVAYTFSMGAMSVWAPIFLQRYHHQTNADATFFFGAVAVVTGLVGTLCGGFLATHLRKKYPLSYHFILMSSILLSIPWTLLAIFSSDVVLVKLGFFMSLFCLFLSTGPVNSVLLESVPASMRATGMAASIFAIHLFGDLWSPEFVGFLSDYFGGLRPAFFVVIFSFVVGAYFWSLPFWRSRKI